MSETVLAKSARGSAYNILVSGATIVLGFTRSVLLLRLLAPDQFGVVTLALFFATVITPFASFGIDSALIQKNNPSPRAFATHFSLRMLMGLGVLGLSLLAAPVLRIFYSGMVVNIFLILQVFGLIEASYATPSIVLRREMRFGPLALLNFFASLAMTITAPLLAYLGAGLWSLVAEQAVGPLVRWVALWLFLRPWRLQTGIDRSEAKSDLKFGSNLVFSNFLGVMLDRFDDFWTGTALGATPLGYYSRSYELAQYPERVLATPITNVFFSAYAALQEKKKELSQAFFRSSSFLVRAGLLLALALFALTPQVTEILFTRKWLPIVPIFRLMLVYIILDPFYINLSYLLMGVGQPALLVRVRLIQLGFFIVGVVGLAALWGVNGVALAANIMMAAGTLVLLAYSRRYVDFSLTRMFAWPALAAIIGGLAGWGYDVFGPDLSLWAVLFVKGGLVTALYSLVLYIGERRYVHQYGLYFLKPILSQLRLRFSR